MEITSPQEMLAILDDIKPAEAIQLKPHILAQYAECVQATQKALEAVELRKQTCDDDDAILQAMSDLQQQKTAELAQTRSEVREEFHSLREHFALEDQATRIRRLTDAVNFLDCERDHMLCVKRGADEIFFLDALENLAQAKAAEAHSAALCSHVTTVAALADVYEAEGGLGILGTRTLQLKAAAATLTKQCESARNASRDARLAYEKQQSARISTGLVRSSLSR
jgi:chemotaxis protein histidine kinase CheA